MTLSTTLAFFGLFMAVVELYIPKLSENLERYLSALQQKLVSMGQKMRNAPDEIRFWLGGTWIGKLYSTLWLPILLVSVPLAIVCNIYEWVKVADVFYVLIALIVVPYVALNYLLNYLWIFALIVSVPVWVFDWLMRTLNFIGRGKASSGVGLLMAFWGLVQPLYFP